MKRGRMLRSFLISLSKAAWAQRIVTGRKFAWKAASRFVAGGTIQEAIIVVKELNAKGINVTLDHLGESTTTPEEAVRATNDILELLDQIEHAGVRANVSVKLTQVGLALNEELCSQNLERILTRAAQFGNFIRIDMEDSPYTEQTIQQYRKMHAKGYQQTGLVIQAYLFRSEKDLKELQKDGTRIRLVKGAYMEPADRAYPKKTDVDANFDRLAQGLVDCAVAAGLPRLSANGRIPPIPAFGTHDPNRIRFAKDYVARLGLPKQVLEFQMLYGIRRDLQNQCVRESYPVRVYVPYGTHWYPYFMRRLAERPANMWFFISNFLRK
jgi:proline dehydrogenase